MHGTWQEIHSHISREGIRHDRTERMQVPGGWLYRTVRTRSDSEDEVIAMAVTFVPDPAADRLMLMPMPVTSSTGE